ncbi:UNVERIFIED_CONTAM: hypothetical protein FKN15_047138 [Acipenser sinensis]
MALDQEDMYDWELFLERLAEELCPGCGAYGHTLAMCPTQFEDDASQIRDAEATTSAGQSVLPCPTTAHTPQGRDDEDSGARTRVSAAGLHMVSESVGAPTTQKMDLWNLIEQINEKAAAQKEQLERWEKQMGLAPLKRQEREPTELELLLQEWEQARVAPQSPEPKEEEPPLPEPREEELPLPEPEGEELLLPEPRGEALPLPEP